ncbi:hypothetical protein [Ascidiimonas aurantiaca]|uniref:hypothetical protein n=1 Tax=Ascidiimonas aurantiaca TaxID=1685432 RepID=UPI0030EE005A
MEKILLKKFSDRGINDFGALMAKGSFGDIPTTMGPPDNPTYRDVHHDRDNDGQWSPGDSFTVFI